MGVYEGMCPCGSVHTRQPVCEKCSRLRALNTHICKHEEQNTYACLYAHTCA